VGGCEESHPIVIESMGLSTIILGKSVIQAGEERKFIWEKRTFFTGRFWGQQERVEWWNLESTLVDMLATIWSY
jgi:hypothetical protein